MAMFTPLLELLEKILEVTLLEQKVKCERFSRKISIVDQDIRGYFDMLVSLCPYTRGIKKMSTIGRS